MLVKSYLFFYCIIILFLTKGFIMSMTLADEKEILEIEKLKQDMQLDMKKFDTSQAQWRDEQELRNRKAFYEAFRLAFYGIAVGVGGTFAIAKTLQLLQATPTP